jgi:hypothetical protein
MSGIMQKNISATANPSCDDGDGIIDINKLLSGIQQKTMAASVNPNSGGMAGEVDGGTRGGSPADSCHSTEESIQGEHTAFLNLARTSYSYDPRPDYTK